MRPHFQQSQDSAAGLWCAVAAYGCWGVMPLYWKQIEAVSALEIMLQRLWWSFALLFLVMLLSGRLPQACRLLKDKRLTLTLLSSGVLISGNWLLFIWAVNDGQIIATSLGYFLAPILNMLCGVVLFKDSLSRPQWLAVILAGIGVGAQVAIAGQLPLVALLLSTSFTLYGVIRKAAPVGALDGMFIETMLLAPVCLVWLVLLGYNQQLSFGAPHGWLVNALLIGTGLITVVPLLCFTYGARHLRLTTLGLVQYMAPTLSLLIGVFVYKEKISLAYIVSFAFIWGGLVIYTWASLRAYGRMRKMMDA